MDHELPRPRSRFPLLGRRKSLREMPVWLEGADFPTQSASQVLPERADVAIIGGGITGLAAAYELARRGASVALLEAQTIGWGASSRNGGMVLSGLKLGPADLLKRYGRVRSRRMFAASLAAIDCVERIVREEHIDCDFQRSGHLLLASKPAHIVGLKEEAALLAREFNHPSRLIPPSELQHEIGSSAYYGGLVDEISAGINPARYSAGLAQAGIRAGAQLFDHTTVRQIQPSAGMIRITTSRGTLRADTILVATGGYTSDVTPLLKRRIIPLGSYIIATAPLSESLAESLIPHNRMVFDTLHLLHYFRLTPDRRMLFGGRAAFFPESPGSIRRSAAMLRRDMLRVFPQLHGIPIEYAWGGTLDVTFDMMPHAGRRGALHYAMGYAGHGVALASYLGTQLGRQLGGDSYENPFESLPFPEAPFRLYNGRAWFLPFAGAWYWLRDQVH